LNEVRLQSDRLFHAHGVWRFKFNELCDNSQNILPKIRSKITTNEHRIQMIDWARFNAQPNTL